MTTTSYLFTLYRLVPEQRQLLCGDPRVPEAFQVLRMGTIGSYVHMADRAPPSSAVAPDA